MNVQRRGELKTAKGIKDPQTVGPGGRRATPLRIDGVQLFELGNVITRSGWMMEIFRADWPLTGVAPQQMNWVQLNPGGVTDWHLHERQTDRLVGVGGTIKLVLFDDRTGSPTRGERERRRHSKNPRAARTPKRGSAPPAAHGGWRPPLASITAPVM